MENNFVSNTLHYKKENNNNHHCLERKSKYKSTLDETIGSKLKG